MNYLIKLFRFLWGQLGRFFLVVLFCLIFLFLLFPFGDLSDRVSQFVSQNTNNRVFVEFKDLTFNPLSATLRLEKVETDTPFFQELKIDELFFTPSIVDIIKKKPGGTLSAIGVMKGKADIEITTMNPIQEAQIQTQIKLNLESISLEELHQTLQLSIPISGQLQSQIDVGLEFDNLSPGQETPVLSLKNVTDGDVSIQVKKFHLPSATVNTPAGKVKLPDLHLANIELKGKLQQGKFTIESGKFGTPSDEIFGTVSGYLNVASPFALGAPIYQLIPSYEIKLEVSAKQVFKDRAEFFLVLFTEIDKDPSGLSRYKLSLKSDNIGLPTPK